MSLSNDSNGVPKVAAKDTEAATDAPPGSDNPFNDYFLLPPPSMGHLFQHSATPMCTTTDARRIINPYAYPAILDEVIAHVDHRTRVALWGTCRALYEHLTAHFYRHVVLGIELRTSDGNPLPSTFADSQGQHVGHAHSIARYTRTFDIVSPLNMAEAHTLFPFLHDMHVRVLRTTTSFNFDSLNVPIPRAPQVVLRTDCIPLTSPYCSGRFVLVPYRIPEAERVVVNASYAWPQQLVASRLTLGNIPALYEGIKEIVFHFKKVGDRDPYLRGIICGCFEVMISASAAMRVGQVGLFFPSVMPVGRGVFEQIAEMYANAIREGRSGVRALRLTMVGVDEFDAARIAEDDVEALNHVIKSAPWAYDKLSAAHRRPGYQPVEPTFVDSVAALVDQSKHEEVHENVKLLPSAEYLAGLDQPENEDWWATA